MAAPTGELTKSQVNKAGKVIRNFVRGGELYSEKLTEALDVLTQFRALHQRPMTAANMGLRSMIKTTKCAEADVSQRLKRIPTIVDKLRREPTLALASMQDLAGCRAILASHDDIERVRERLVSLRRVERVSDYIARPRDSGYRGVHVIVSYHERMVEIQLRTRAMHEWAVTVESLSSLLGRDVKAGEGPREVQDLMRLISHAMALEELGHVVDDEMLAHMRLLRTAAAPHLVGGRT